MNYKINKKLLLIFITILSLNISLFAKKPLTPTKKEATAFDVKVVDTKEAKKLYDNGAVFADSRRPVEVSMLHIKGAVRTFYNEKGGNKQRKTDWDNSKDKFDTKALPKDKNTNIIFYCNGARCWKSYKATVEAMKLGYKNSYWYRDGIPAWKKAKYPVE